MSAALARSVVQPQHEPQPRHIEIVSTRAQRRARPRLLYALVTVGGLFAVLIAQLLLSIAVSDGAYQIASLQQQQRELQRDAETLTEAIQVLQSPQHLAVNAVALGMVSNSSTAYLRLSDGAVLGSAVAATAGDRIVIGHDNSTLVSNSLLTGVPLTAHALNEHPVTTGVPAVGEETSSVASSGHELPAIKTR
ncbi:MAG: hypothetical protein KF680_01385 [Cryobacterium sp.]|nr:hypothetical protein [Cryobacterium sp.]